MADAPADDPAVGELADQQNQEVPEAGSEEATGSPTQEEVSENPEAEPTSIDQVSENPPEGFEPTADETESSNPAPESEESCAANAEATAETDPGVSKDQEEMMDTDELPADQAEAEPAESNDQVEPEPVQRLVQEPLVQDEPELTNTDHDDQVGAELAQPEDQGEQEPTHLGEPPEAEAVQAQPAQTDDLAEPDLPDEASTEPVVDLQPTSQDPDAAEKNEENVAGEPDKGKAAARSELEAQESQTDKNDSGHDLGTTTAAADADEMMDVDDADVAHADAADADVTEKTSDDFNKEAPEQSEPEVSFARSS